MGFILYSYMKYFDHTHSKTIKNVRTKIFLTHGGTCCGHAVAHVVGTLGTKETFCVKTSWNLLGFILYSFMRYFGHSHSKTKKNARTNFFLTRGGTCCGHVVAHVVGTLGTTKTFCVKTSWNLLGFILYSYMRYSGHSHSKTMKNARTNLFLTRGGTCCGHVVAHVVGTLGTTKTFCVKTSWNLLGFILYSYMRYSGHSHSETTKNARKILFFWHAVAHVVGTSWHILWAH